MKYRVQDGGSDLFAFIDHQKKAARIKAGISKLSGIIGWEGFRKVLENVLCYAGRDNSKGFARPSIRSSCSKSWFCRNTTDSVTPPSKSRWQTGSAS
jgi:hypothetical protein